MNKSDRNDARGIAQMVRVNMIRPVHVKTVSSQEKRMLRARAELLTTFNELHKMVLVAVRADPVCRRMMTIPGVGPVTALTLRRRADDDQQALRIVLEPGLHMDAVGPEVDIGKV